MVGSKNRFAQEIVEAKFFDNLNSIDDLIKILNAQRELIDEHKLNDISNWGLEDLEGFIHYAPTPLFNLALDKEGYEILAWSDEDDSVVRTPHKTGDA